MKPSIFTAIILLIISRCASKPYAIIDGSKSRAADSYSYDIVITGVDGKMLLDGLKVRNVEPGPHTFQLITTKKDKYGDYTYQLITIDTEPCKRYVIAAKHDRDKKFSNKFWEVEVLRVEPVPRCEKLLQEQKQQASDNG